MPCSQVFLSHNIPLLGPDLVGQMHMETPLAIPLMIFMTTKVIGGQSGDWIDSHAGPTLNWDWI